MITKRIACAALALSLLGSTAASAAPWGHGGWHGGGWHHHGWHGGGPLFLGLGLGILAIGAIAHDEAVDRDRERYERNRAYEQDRDFRDHGFEPGERGGPYRGDDEGNGPGAPHAYRDAQPPPPDGGRSYNGPDADDRDAPPPPSHQRAYRDAPPPQDSDRDDDDARGAPHQLHHDDDGDDN
jgi:hypothetical protein